MTRNLANLTVLVLDNIKMSYLSQRINRMGMNIILAFDRSDSYPYFESEDGISVDNEDYSAGEAADNALSMLDALQPDLILLGHCQGAGLDKTLLFPQNKKAKTIVLSNDPLEGEELAQYVARGFERFCIRRELLKCFQSFIQGLEALQQIKAAQELEAQAQMAASHSLKVSVVQ